MLAFAAGLPEPAFASCREIAALPLRTEPGGLVSVSASADQKPLNLVVDTGTGLSLIDADTARGFGWIATEPSRTMERLAGGIVVRAAVRLESLRLGDVAMAPGDVGVAANLALADTGGMLGADILSRYDVELDVGNSVLKLFEAGGCPPLQPVVAMLGARGNEIVIPVSLDGRDLEAVLDSGAERSFTSIASAHNRLGLDPDSLGPATEVVLNGAERINVYPRSFANLRVGGLDFGDQIVEIQATAAGRRRPPDLVLGMDFLRRVRVYISYRDRRLGLQPLR